MVTKLHYLVDEHGMNLTKALLASIIKYPVSSLEIDPVGPIRAHKMGYLRTPTGRGFSPTTSFGMSSRRGAARETRKKKTPKARAYTGRPSRI